MELLFNWHQNSGFRILKNILVCHKFRIFLKEWNFTPQRGWTKKSKKSVKNEEKQKNVENIYFPFDQFWSRANAFGLHSVFHSLSEQCDIHDNPLITFFLSTQSFLFQILYDTMGTACYAVCTRWKRIYISFCSEIIS